MKLLATGVYTILKPQMEEKYNVHQGLSKQRKKLPVAQESSGPQIAGGWWHILRMHCVRALFLCYILWALFSGHCQRTDKPCGP